MTPRSFLLNVQKIKSLAQLRVAVKHNLRENVREIALGGRVDPGRSHLNVILAGEHSADAVMEHQAQLVAVATAARTRKGRTPAKVRSDAVRAVEFLFSLPPASGIDEDAFFRQALSWLELRYQVPVLSCIVHRDEGQGHPHMHALLLPVRDGAWIGSAMVGVYAKMQADFHAQVGALFGLSYAPRVNVATRREAALAAQAAIDADPALVQTPEFRAWFLAAAERNPARLLEILGLKTARSPAPAKQWVRIMTRPVAREGRASTSPNHIGFDRELPDASPRRAPLKPSPVLSFIGMPSFAVSGTGLSEPGNAGMHGSCKVIPFPSRDCLLDPGRTVRLDDDYTRVPDDLPVELYDTELGEFRQPGHASSEQARAHADDIVSSREGTD
jgi:hypothetical protein